MLGKDVLTVSDSCMVMIGVNSGIVAL